MKKLMMEVELEYDDETMHGKDEDSVAWFWNERPKETKWMNL